jgi:hypothetical protein
MREFKEGITGESKDDDKNELTQAQASPAPGQDRPAEPARSSSTEGQPRS